MALAADDVSGQDSVHDVSRTGAAASVPQLIGRALILLPLLAGCAADRPGDPPPLTGTAWPDLRTVPRPPESTDTAEERADIGDDLLATRAAQAYERDLLRWRVGLIGQRPEAPGPSPTLPRPKGLKLPEPLLAADSLEARFLRQQIRSEVNSEGLNDFLDVVAIERVDVSPLDRLTPERAPADGVQLPGSLGRSARAERPGRSAPPGRPLLDRLLGIDPPPT